MAKKFKTIKIDNGMDFDVRIDNNGVFSTTVLSSTVENKSLENLEAEIIRLMGEDGKLEFKPVIIIRVNQFSGSYDTSREFRGTDIDGILYYKSWVGEITRQDEFFKDHDKYLPGDCSRYVKYQVSTNTRDSINVIDYTPEKWKSIEKIEEQIKILKTRLGEILLGADSEKFLKSINTNTIKLIE